MNLPEISSQKYLYFEEQNVSIASLDLILRDMASVTNIRGNIPLFLFVDTLALWAEVWLMAGLVFNLASCKVLAMLPVNLVTVL